MEQFCFVLYRSYFIQASVEQYSTRLSALGPWCPHSDKENVTIFGRSETYVTAHRVLPLLFLERFDSTSRVTWRVTWHVSATT
jgi:hypothetical protein